MEKKFIGYLWKGVAPSRVVVLSWKFLFDRIPSRVNLARCNIVPPGETISCALCDAQVETANHLFLFCDVSRGVWFLVMRWLEFSFTPYSSKSMCIWSVEVVERWMPKYGSVFGLFGRLRFGQFGMLEIIEFILQVGR